MASSSPLALLALALSLLAASATAAAAAALPASLLRDVRRAELYRAGFAAASVPGPLASAPAPVRPVRSAPAPAPAPDAAPGVAPGDAPRADDARQLEPKPAPAPAVGTLRGGIDADTEKAAAAAVVAAAAAGDRPKRDLGVDPEELLALLALWQQQQLPQLPGRAPLSLDAPALDRPLAAVPLAPPLYRPPGRLPGYDLSDPDDWALNMDNNDLDSEEEGPVGAWLEAPPFAQAAVAFGGARHPAFFLPPPPPHAAPAAASAPGGLKRDALRAAHLGPDKRFMVSRKRQVSSQQGSEEGMRYLARLLAPPPRNPGIPLVRRVLL